MSLTSFSSFRIWSSMNRRRRVDSRLCRLMLRLLVSTRNLHRRRRDDDGEQNRQEEYEHRDGELRRQPRRLLLRIHDAHVPLLLRKDAQRLADGGPVLLGLLQTRDHPLDAIEPRAVGEILVRLAAA